MIVHDDELINELVRRIVPWVNQIMLTNNESVYLDRPVPVSFKRGEQGRITPRIMQAIVSRRVRIRHCIVAKVEMADVSRSQILITLRKANV